MMSSGEDCHKQVHFANGFPPKEVVVSPRLSPPVNMHGGIFVGLHDEVPSRLTQHGRLIPPLAKRRGQFCAVNPRHEISVDIHQPDPFSGHKGAEKTGFTAYPIKHFKPSQPKKRSKVKRVEGKNPIAMLNFQSAISQATVPPSNTQEGTPVETLASKCDKIMADVEKDFILSELSGIDEVYQRICHGNKESLHSLVLPVRNKRKKYSSGNLQYLSVSSQVMPSIKHNHKPSYPLKNNKPQAINHQSLDEKTHCYEDDDGVQKIPKEPRAILVPLPFFKRKSSQPPQTAPARHKAIQTPLENARHRLAKHHTRRAISSLSGWSSPSIINFSPAGLPEASRPGTRACNATGSIVGVQNRSNTGTVAIVASLDQPNRASPYLVTPPATAASGLVTKQSFYDEDFEVDRLPESEMVVDDPAENKSEKMSVTSEEEHIIKDDTCADPMVEGMQRSMQCLSIVLNVTTEDGMVDDVEIFDPSKRDVEKEERIAHEIEEVQKQSQKKKEEIEALLDEHGEIIKEVHQLEEDLHQ
ncbi:uncharacterized protein LOC5521857 [Nematostella vectensis]|uniref:uncharacterized protein LOC5521857 n=1 Tax=Nematostella vectensis TaxID=45351 RepID=UPI002076F4F9|nr:uncharacterized protein LOC5521857 [Nematostella vectensis]XP_032222921.2 uncharacterized protein LOC5521857 [Nematostella vectensis]